MSISLLRRALFDRIAHTRSNAESVAISSSIDEPRAARRAESIRIAIISHDLSGGGAERVGALLATGLAKKGHTVDVLIERERLENKTYLDPAVNLILLEGNSRQGRLFSLLKHLRARQYDIINAINPLLTLQVLILSRYSGPKRAAVIGSYHGFAPMPGLFGRASYLFTPAITRLADQIVCVSNTFRADLIEHWGAKADKLTVIHNPVAVPKTISAHGSEELPLNYILFVGRLSTDKNPALALKAFEQLPKRFNHFDLVMLGEGPMRDELLHLAESLNINSRVHFLGYVAEPWVFYKNAKAVISTSNSETFGLSVVEALAYGVPVIATKSGGPEEILDRGRFGALVPIGDPSALSAAIANTIDSPPTKEMLRARAAQFSPDKAIEAYERLFSRFVIERERLAVTREN